MLQRFQVEGQQNREIYFRELFKAEKQPATAAVMSTRPISCRRRPAVVIHIDTM